MISTAPELNTPPPLNAPTTLPEASYAVDCTDSDLHVPCHLTSMPVQPYC